MKAMFELKTLDDFKTKLKEINDDHESARTQAGVRFSQRIQCLEEHAKKAKVSFEDILYK